MPKAAHKVVVIGHRNPDTDSICSAIAYAELKNKTSDLVCEPRRAGKMNQETEFVLKKFGVKPPRMCTDVNPKIRDVDYREMPGIPGSTSLRKAWEIMRDKQIDTLPVTSPDNELEGVITVKDIATANMDVFDTGILAKSQTTYRNILETLGGTMVVGREDDVCTTGHIRIGTATPEMLENSMEKGDIVILTNRYESQLCAIEKEASLIIICNGAKVGRTIQRIAEEMGVAIMSAPVDTYAAGKLISQCAPISYYMTRSDIMKFTLVTPVADVTRVMAKVRHRYFPILDQPPQHHCAAQAPHYSGGPQRSHTGRGGLRSGRDPGDHRSSPHRQSGDQRPGVLPQPAGGLHGHHHHPDVRRERYGDPAADRRPSAGGHPFGYAGVPQPHLHPAG